MFLIKIISTSVVIWSKYGNRKVASLYQRCWFLFQNACNETWVESDYDDVNDDNNDDSNDKNDENDSNDKTTTALEARLDGLFENCCSTNSKKQSIQ